MRASAFLSSLALMHGVQSVSAAEEANLKSGTYDELVLGYDGSSHEVTGSYSSATGGGQFSCIFFLKGRLEGNKAQIATWFPKTPKEVIEGTLEVKPKGEVVIALKEEHGGCSNVQHFADKREPASFTLSKAHPWTSVRVVKAKKAYFFMDEKAPAPTKVYVVEGDAVGVLEKKGAFVHAQFAGEKRTTSGWLREEDLFPDHP